MIFFSNTIIDPSFNYLFKKKKKKKVIIIIKLEMKDKEKNKCTGNDDQV